MKLVEEVVLNRNTMQIPRGMISNKRKIVIKLSKTENSPLQFIKITLINLRFRRPDILLYDCWYLLFSRHFKIKLPPRKYV